MRGRRSKPANRRAITVAVIAVLVVVVLGAVLLSRSGSGLFAPPSREELQRRVSELNEKAQRGKLYLWEAKRTLGLGDSTIEQGDLHIWDVPARGLQIICEMDGIKVGRMVWIRVEERAGRGQLGALPPEGGVPPPPVPTVPPTPPVVPPPPVGPPPPVVENPGVPAIRKIILEVLNEMPESLWPNTPTGWDELREPRLIEWLRQEGFTRTNLEAHGLTGTPFLTVVRVSNVTADYRGYGKGKYMIRYTVSPCKGALGTIQWKGVTFAVTWSVFAGSGEDIFAASPGGDSREVYVQTPEEQVARQALKRKGQFVLVRWRIADIRTSKPNSFHVSVWTPSDSDPILDLEEKNGEKERGQ